MNETYGRSDMENLGGEAGAAIGAAAEAGREELGQARERVGQAMDSAKQMAGRVRDQAADYARQTDVAVRDNPYTAVGLALGIGALLGYLITVGFSRRND